MPTLPSYRRCLTCNGKIAPATGRCPKFEECAKLRSPHKRARRTLAETGRRVRESEAESSRFGVYRVKVPAVARSVKPGPW